jgi:hypothetical protein
MQYALKSNRGDTPQWAAIDSDGNDLNCRDDVTTPYRMSIRECCDSYRFIDQVEM